MADFRMPTLGADMEAGRLVEWKVKSGDQVRRGDIVAVVETDKGAIDVEIWEDGVVEELLVEPGSEVPVGTVLARVLGKGAPGSPPPSPKPAPAPAVRPEAPAAPPAGVPRARASPAARARARELGVDLASVQGSGPGGAVTLGDVEAVVVSSASAPASLAGGGEPGRAGGPSPMRQAIAAAMARSKREIPHYYLSAEIDLSRALAWLAEVNLARSVADRILPAALLLRAVAKAAREVPEMNGRYVDGAFEPAGAVHLGVVVALRQGGIVAPAIHDADAKPLGDLMRALADLVARARNGGLRSSELSDATLTVTSLGDLGAESVYGVIYPPQVAIVGLGRIGERPRAVAGKLEARPCVTATLAGDHRVSDGLRGARFLASLDRHLQAPEEP